MIKTILNIFLVFTFIFSAGALLAQPDEKDNDLMNLDLNQEQWEAVRDLFAVEAIKLLARMDTLQHQIDSLKDVSTMIDVYDCEAELYAVAGATKEEVSSFRIMFSEAEKRINSRFGAPGDLQQQYIEEIKASKITCLPEFSDRYSSMMKKFTEWYSDASGEYITESSYKVVKGDFLWKISKKKYNTPYLWPAIWDANKTSVLNAGDFLSEKYHRILNPNNIYPGQVLKIPVLSSKDRKEAEEKSKMYRKTRK